METIAFTFLGNLPIGATFTHLYTEYTILQSVGNVTRKNGTQATEIKVESKASIAYLDNATVVCWPSFNGVAMTSDDLSKHTPVVRVTNEKITIY